MIQIFFKKIFKKTEKTPLLKPMIYGLFSGGKKYVLKF